MPSPWTVDPENSWMERRIHIQRGQPGGSGFDSAGRKPNSYISKAHRLDAAHAN